MPVYRRKRRTRQRRAPTPPSPSKRPCAASAIACRQRGRQCRHVQRRSAPCQSTSVARQHAPTRSGRSAGWSSAPAWQCHRARPTPQRAQSRMARAASRHRPRTSRTEPSSAAWLSTENEAGSTMSAGATPVEHDAAASQRETAACTQRRRSVPYDAPTRLIVGAPSALADCLDVGHRDRRRVVAPQVAVRQAHQRARHAASCAICTPRIELLEPAAATRGHRFHSAAAHCGRCLADPRTPRSRRLFRRPSWRGRSGPPARCALCPGPPAKKNTGSGSLLCASAGSTAKCTSILHAVGPRRIERRLHAAAQRFVRHAS